MKKLWKRNCKEKTRIFEHSRLSREKFNYISMQEKLLILGDSFSPFLLSDYEVFPGICLQEWTEWHLKKIEKKFH